MKYRKLGNTGLIVSEVALGTMQFGGKMNMGNLGQEATTQMVKPVVDSGINFIDTADVYSLGAWWKYPQCAGFVPRAGGAVLGALYRQYLEGYPTPDRESWSALGSPARSDRAARYGSFVCPHRHDQPHLHCL